MLKSTKPSSQYEPAKTLRLLRIDCRLTGRLTVDVILGQGNAHVETWIPR